MKTEQLTVTRAHAHMNAIIWVVLMVIAVPVLSAYAEEEGTVHLYIFDPVTPLVTDEFQCEHEGTLHGFGGNGVLRLSMVPGRHELHLLRNRRTIARIACPVVAGETTEIMVTLGREGAEPRVDIETPQSSLLQMEGKEPAADSPPGTLKCSVRDIERGQPITLARVFFRGLSVEGITGVEGTLRLELPSGSHAMSIIHARYATQTIEPLIITPNETTIVAIEMTPSSFELEEYRVVAVRIEGGIASLIEERKLSSHVTDIIGSEEIAKSGDSDAASALKRVTGLTVVGGKYVFVRGMGERYSSSLLNGAAISSPEPERRVVPLDLFSVDVLESMEIQKTYSPDMPGEFGGGTVKIRTRGIPSGFILGISQSTGYNSQTTGKHGLTYGGGDTDWLGVDDGTRALPDGIHNASHVHVGTPNYPGYTRDEIEAFGQSLKNTWVARDFTAPPDTGFSLTTGNRHDIFRQSRVGYLFSYTYGNSYQTTERDYINYGVADNTLVANDSYLFNQTTRNIEMGGILGIGLDIGEHNSVRYTSTLMRITEDRALRYEGLAGDQDDYIRVNSLRWIEQMLFTNQLTGSHTCPFLDDLALDWLLTHSTAVRDEPDRRHVKYEYDESRNAYRLSTLSDGNSRIFSELDGATYDAAVSFSKGYGLWRGFTGRIRVGAGYMSRDRVVDTRRFIFNRGPQIPFELLYLEPEDLFSEEHIFPYGMELQESTLKTDHYDAEQTISSYFLMTESRLGERFDLMFGLRVESSDQVVRTFALHSTTDYVIEARLKNSVMLPSFTATWKFFEDMQMRIAYSQTVSRPDFRELSPAQYNDVTGGREIVGNPELEHAVIENFDIRGEWYPSAQESLSIGLFYKQFENPIEHTIDGGSNSQISFVNADGANNYGLEVEFRKNMSFIHEYLEDFTIAGNIAFIKSEVVLDVDTGEETSKNRPLQGQSPYVVNFSLTYDNPDTKTSISLLYNTFGKRIANVGYGGLPDIYEQPFHHLDLVASRKISGGFGVKVKFKNILDEAVRYTQQNETTESYTTGRSISLGLSWSL